MNTVSEKVIIPLDGLDERAALSLASMLQGQVWGFKVNDLLVEQGCSIISKLKAYGRVFADAKLYDIPNTVANGIQRLSAAGADLITVHASGGRRMLEAAAKSKGKAQILAVTVLTSFSEEEAVEVYYRNPSICVPEFATLALESFIDGIVCSPLELGVLPQREKSYLKVIPGIRPEWYQAADDQRRTATPKAAIAAGATHLVIGRPITEHANPREAVALLNRELGSA